MGPHLGGAQIQKDHERKVLGENYGSAHHASGRRYRV